MLKRSRKTMQQMVESLKNLALVRKRNKRRRIRPKNWKQMKRREIMLMKMYLIKKMMASQVEGNHKRINRPKRIRSQKKVLSQTSRLRHSLNY